MVLELVDDPFIKIVDNKLLNPLIEKLPDDVKPIVIETLDSVIDEMELIEIQWYTI